MNWGWLNSKYHLEFKVLSAKDANEFLKTIQPFRIRQYQITPNAEKVCIWYEVKDD